MKDISTLPNIDTATANQDRGVMRDDITPGDEHGTPVRQDYMNDLYYGLRAIMAHAGLTPDGSVEGVTASQVRQAIDRLLNGWPTRSLNKSADYTILDTDYFDTLFVNTTSDDIVITLPLLANNYGRSIKIVYAAGTTNTVTIQTNTSDNGKLTPSGLTSMVLSNPGDSVVLEGSSLADKWIGGDLPLSLVPKWIGCSKISETTRGSTNPNSACYLKQRTIAIISNAELDTYAWNGVSWAIVGSGMGMGGAGYSAITRLSDSLVALIHTATQSLRAYSWSGSAWSLVGSGLSISNTSYMALAALTSTTVAYIDTTNESLRVYSWSGSAWSLVGSGLSISGLGNVTMTAINQTDIALYDSTTEKLRTYRWNGSSWSLVGAENTLTGYGNCAITMINKTDLVICSQGTGLVHVYRWNGSAWVFHNTIYSGTINTPDICTCGDMEIMVKLSVSVDTITHLRLTPSFIDSPRSISI
ncbi:MAG: hypothetical protein KA369_08320 [Spirochaetes bacterium]|nr:hypothetical protein [Spirochaetota bacterium]